jgi:hypothetical protein
MKRLNHSVAFLCLLMLGATPIRGQWTATNLNPEGIVHALAYGAAGNIQVGGISRAGTSGTENLASLWSGTAESWVDLSPNDYGPSGAYGASGNQQVG